MKQYIKNILYGTWTMIVGLRITLSYLFSRAVTMQYPDERWEIPDGYRGMLINEIEKCTGCKACALACPTGCFHIETVRGEDKKLKPIKFDIDLSKCMFCNLCVEACPPESLKMTKNYEACSYTRDGVIYHFGLEK